MDYQFIVGKLSEVIWHCTLLLAIVGLTKIFLINFFLYKITMAKKSEIKFTRRENQHRILITKTMPRRSLISIKI